ncbi:MAG: diaminopimelate epimerase [Candidatus Krumholzibacteriota bacterium]|nr:diaminopimelate epimerase [Candidatus Krumholzibacteriota bacterium]
MADDLEFVKMHGAGNDFIMISDLAEAFDGSRDLISSLCAPHRGIGADGLILLRASAEADFRMRYFNRDGGEADMCGNGARCAALFAYNSGLAGKSMVFQTNAGKVEADITHDGVRLLLGEVNDLRLNIELEDLEAKAGFAVCGVPHAAVLDEAGSGWSGDEFLSWARAIRHHRAFQSAGTNVNLVTVISKHNLQYRTYERGVEAETLACGTGAAAVAVITSHMHLTASPVSCLTSGGDVLLVEFEQRPGGAVNCRLTGPAVTTFRGRLSIGDFIPSPSAN